MERKLNLPSPLDISHTLTLNTHTHTQWCSMKTMEAMSIHLDRNKCQTSVMSKTMTMNRKKKEGEKKFNHQNRTTTTTKPIDYGCIILYNQASLARGVKK